MDTYKEPIYRYRIVRHDNLPEAHKQAYLAEGIDPDNLWSLIWSFKDKEVAKKHLNECETSKENWETFKLVDSGVEVEYIDRLIY